MKKIFGLITCILVSLVIITGADAYASENLIINGSGENEMEGWTEETGSENLWFPSTSTTSHTAIDGKTFFWPSRNACKYACMYQDVDVSGYESGTWMNLSAWLANYNQSPHDQATIKVQILDAFMNVLYEDYSLQRNPEWQFHELNFTIPQGAAWVRVLCIADRFVGADNDAYFDDITLTLAEDEINPVIITGDKTSAKPGEQIQLSATDGKYKKASYYEWSSSYDSIATVDENGLVTMIENPDKSLIDAEVWIYAKSKKTGVIGKYFINSERENIESVVTVETTTPSSENNDNSGNKPEKVNSLAVVSLKLKWNKSKNASGYYIYQYNNETGKYEKILTIKKGTKTSCTIDDLETDNVYKFKVVAYKTEGNKKIKSSDSNIITITIN